MYVLKVEKKDGKLVNAVIANLGKVAQEEVWKWWRKQTFVFFDEAYVKALNQIFNFSFAQLFKYQFVKAIS